MKKVMIISIVMFLMSGFSMNSQKTCEECFKGNIKYSVADYFKESKAVIKGKYQTLFYETLYHSMNDYFCQEEIRNLPIIVNYQEAKQAHIVAPVFINLSTNDGIYSKRIHSLAPDAKELKYKKGYPHYLFIISHNQYIHFGADVEKNNVLIEKYLSNSFSEEEIKTMCKYFNHWVIFDYYVHYPPYLIKNNQKVIFDIEHL